MKQTIITPALQNIKVTDPLFGRYADMIAEKLLPYQWDVLNDRVAGVEPSWCIRNFRVAAGESDAPRLGAVFCDTDAYKWLEAVAFCLASGRGREYEQTADELIDLFYSLNSAYRKNAVWLLNDSTMKNIRKLKDSNGQYLWQPALHEGGFDTLLGKRIYTSPYAPELAAGQKTVAFGDFNYYWIGDRLGITFKRLNERFAETGQIGFIASKRLDGKLILPEAIKVLQQKGTASSGG